MSDLHLVATESTDGMIHRLAIDPQAHDKLCRCTACRPLGRCDAQRNTDVGVVNCMARRGHDDPGERRDPEHVVHTHAGDVLVWTGDAPARTDAAVIRAFARLCRLSATAEVGRHRDAAQVVMHGAAEYAEEIAVQLEHGHMTIAAAADLLEAHKPGQATTEAPATVSEAHSGSQPSDALDGALAIVIDRARRGILTERPATTFVRALGDFGFRCLLQASDVDGER